MSAAALLLRLPRPFDALPWPPRIDWRRGLAQGGVLGVMTAFVDFPLATMLSMLGPATGTAYLFTFFLIGSIRGAALSWMAQWVEGRLAWTSIVALFLVESALLAVLQHPVEQLLRGLWLDNFLTTNLTMSLWRNLAYGSVFFAYCLATQRALRVRGVLARAEIERERSATALNEASLDAMAARVDPALLLRVLTEARRAYARRHDGADALLDALVAFLRLAMPAVRSGRSTLLTELALLRAHSALLAQLGAGPRVCTVQTDLPSRDIAFPPLLLIPLVEAAARQGARPPHVSLAERDGGLMLTVDAATAEAWMDDTMAQRVDRALRDLHAGPEARCEVGASPSLTLWLPLSPTPAKVPHDTATA